VWRQCLRVVLWCRPSHFHCYLPYHAPAPVAPSVSAHNGSFPLLPCASPLMRAPHQLPSQMKELPCFRDKTWPEDNVTPVIAIGHSKKRIRYTVKEYSPVRCVDSPPRRLPLVGAESRRPAAPSGNACVPLRVASPTAAGLVQHDPPRLGPHRRVRVGLHLWCSCPMSQPFLWQQLTPQGCGRVRALVGHFHVCVCRDIQANFDAYDGFVVLHGTDTMAFTASALSFMFKNLSKTVIITGSQISMAFPVSGVRSRATPCFVQQPTPLESC
jgi:hypothetical protein